MAFKLGTYLTHVSADPSKWKGSVLSNILQRGRDLVEGVAAWGGRQGAAIKWQTGITKVEPALQLAKPRVSAVGLRKSAILFKNVANGIFLKSHPETLVSRYAQKIAPHPYWSSFRTHKQFHSIGRRLAAYSLVGISFAASSQSQLLSCDDDLADLKVFSDIRRMFGTKSLARPCGEDDYLMSNAKLDNLELGSLITAGAQAAIFEARLKPDAVVMEVCNINDQELPPSGEPFLDHSFHTHELKDHSLQSPDISVIEEKINAATEIFYHHQEQLSDIIELLCDQNGRLSKLCGMSVEEPMAEFSEDCDSISSIEIIGDDSVDSIEILECTPDDSLISAADVNNDLEIYSDVDSQDDYVSLIITELAELVAMAEENGRHYNELSKRVFDHNQRLQKLTAPCDIGYDITIKVIWMTDCSEEYTKQLLANELLPAVSAVNIDSDTSWNRCKLPYHFNVAPVVGGFLTTVQDVKGACAYRHELPAVNNWQQDLAACVVTKRYEFTLAEFLASHDPGLRDSLLLLLQLLEAVVHMSHYGVCHRNLNNSNIYVELLADGPHLVVCNFGSSFRHRTGFGYRATCDTDEMYKCGYNYLLAPELVTGCSSSNTKYGKADLWSCGAIAYEIFDRSNPFCQTRNGRRLSNSRYAESELPNLPDSVPPFLNGLVKLMLQKDPAKRPNPEVVANLLHIVLWAPDEWQFSVPSGLQIRRWITQFAATTYCSQFVRQHQKMDDGVSRLEDKLKLQFLSRADHLLISEAAHLLCIVSDYK